MITLLMGENSLFVERRLAELIEAFDGEVERYEGDSLEPTQWPELLMGVTLFSASRMIVIKRLLDNTAAYQALETWLPRVSDETHVVFVEPAPDKRTRTYKALKAAANVEEFPLWTERDTQTAVQFARDEATQQGYTLSPELARLVVARTGNDAWAVYRAVERLSFADTIDEATIETLVELHPRDNIFTLFEAALKGETAAVHDRIATLSLTNDPYQTMGLLSTQAFQLAALAAASRDQDVAKDFGVHPFVLSKLRTYAAKLGMQGVGRIANVLAKADDALKQTAADPWLIIERALIEIALQK